mgnify:CR=1 FL=1
MSSLIGIGIVIGFAAFCMWRFIKWRAASVFSFNDFTKVVHDAANAGEVAYRAQVEEINRRNGKNFRPSKRGLAMARVLCALFPVAAYVVTEEKGALPKSLRAGRSPLGKEMWSLASECALLPLGLASDHPDRAPIDEDSRRAAAKFIGYFENMFNWNPGADLALAITQLGPLWSRAIHQSIEGESVDTVGYSLQFCTSGLETYTDWVLAFEGAKRR